MGTNHKERIVRARRYPRNTNTKKITLECQKKDMNKNIIKCKPFTDMNKNIIKCKPFTTQ
jgi:hypothetical protein